MNIRRVWLCAIAVLAICADAAACGSPGIRSDDCKADVAIAWNERVLAVASAEDKFLTLKGVRAAAMMHIAMHDAVNSIQRRYGAYAFSGDGAGADPVAAAAQAAYEVAVHEYPDQKTALEKELAGWFDASSGAGKERAIALGKASAATILKRREGDGWNNEAQYQWQPMGPGVYAEFHEHSGTPQGFVFGSGWATVKTFTLKTQDQFRVSPPPSIDSDAYVAAYNDVKEVGRFDSRTRTKDQTHLALWWKDFVENSHNRLARQLAAKQGSDLWTAARMFALLNMGVADAYIACFDSKFAYNHWRPYTAIRWAANDGNPRTEPDLQWDNTHRHTYAFPSYPSAHGSACGAAMTVLADTYGDRYSFTMETRGVNAAGPMSPMMAMDPPTRSFDSFSAAAMECAMSRVYLGIHFRYDSVAGNELGTAVGRHAVTSYLGASR